MRRAGKAFPFSLSEKTFPEIYNAGGAACRAKVTMDYTTLGRTGLRVSRMGLGCGGHSRLGLSANRGEENAIRIVREAIDLGVNLIDTAEGYRTEEVVGKALADIRREDVVLCTKAGVHWEDRYATPEETRMRVDACLKRLNTDYVDIFHVHGVRPEHYAYARDEIHPVLTQLKAQGKIRFIGITEQFGGDTAHEMLPIALDDDLWDVAMIGFNILNQSARDLIFPKTQARNVGTLDMFAVRKALSDPLALRELMAGLVGRGEVDPNSFDPETPLDFLLANGIASSVTEAAYRFCRWESGVDVILSGTGNVEHLRENVKSINGPPLPPATIERLQTMFHGVKSVSGN